MQYTQPALFPVEDIQTDGYAQPENDDQADTNTDETWAEAA